MRLKFICLLAMTGLGWAQSGEFNFHAGSSRFNQNVIARSEGANVLLDNGWLFGFRLTLNQGDWIGHEFGYQYNRTSLGFSAGQDLGGMAVHRSFYSTLLYATREGTRVRPFLAGGGQFANFVPPGSSAVQGGGENKFGFHYGAGVKVKVNDSWMIRFDVREYNQSKPFARFFQATPGRLRQQEFSLGFSFTM
jgi:opacity protein-like surface antigen